MLTDNSRAYCGHADSHPIELLLPMEDIKHCTTKIRSPRTNGFVERMSRTLRDECFCVTGRTTSDLEVNEIQRDLDRLFCHYNRERIHWGYCLLRRTRARALPEAGLPLS